jgi:hypothetical protein
MPDNEIPSVLVVDVASNTEITRPMNDEELAQLEIVLLELAENDSQAQEKAAAKASAIAKLAELGLTAEEIAAL